jgi:hypothetical protein
MGQCRPGKLMVAATRPTGRGRGSRGIAGSGSLLAGGFVTRPTDQVCCGPLVQDFGREVRSVGPGDSADVGVDSYLHEECRIVQWGEYSVAVLQMGQIDVADQAVREREPQPVVAEDFHVADVVQRGDRERILR